MFLHFCKQTFNISHVCISQNVKGNLMRNLQLIIFTWTRRYWQIFKSALVCVPLKKVFVKVTYLVKSVQSNIYVFIFCHSHKKLLCNSKQHWIISTLLSVRKQVVLYVLWMKWLWWLFWRKKLFDVISLQ